MNKNKNLLLTLLLTLLAAVGFTAFFSARWYINTYGDRGFDAVIYTLTGGMNGTESSLIIKYLKGGALPALICTVICSAAVYFLLTKKITKPNLTAVTVLVLSTVLSCRALAVIGLPEYIKNSGTTSTLFENYYIDPDDTAITFPEQKRNLIYIFLESVESTYYSEEQGGAMDECLIPKLHRLAEKNVNFSHNDGIGGYYTPSGTDWTIGAMVAHSAGVPLKVPDSAEDDNSYAVDGAFLPGITALGDILDANGYNQAVMMGSVSTFGGRKAYYETHCTDIYDLRTSYDDGLLPEGFSIWWGMEDYHLYEYAKQKITLLSQQDEPFAFSMLTVDTHSVGGYICGQCENSRTEPFDNVLLCSDNQLKKFTNWLKKQDFYENTTIIICGDHLSMDAEYFDRTTPKDYDRTAYNCFINSVPTPVNTKNRVVTSFDFFPSTLAAMGCEIEGDRLGLGTNLFSSKPTLAEEMGYEEFNLEVSRRSDYYAREFRMETGNTTETE